MFLSREFRFFSGNSEIRRMGRSMARLVSVVLTKPKTTRLCWALQPRSVSDIFPVVFCPIHSTRTLPCISCIRSKAGSVSSAKKKRAARKNAKKGAKARWKNHPQDIKKMMKKENCSRQWASVLVKRERERHENSGHHS